MRLLFNLSVVATFLLIGFSVFYYFVVFLPSQEKNKQQVGKNKIQVHADCAQEADQRAKSTLQKKIEIAQGQTKIFLQETFDKGMYLKEDYNSYYTRCLQRNGILE